MTIRQLAGSMRVKAKLRLGGRRDNSITPPSPPLPYCPSSLLSNIWCHIRAAMHAPTIGATQ